MTFIRWFDDVRLTDRDQVGGKCASLGELVSAGFDVPAGFAVTVDAYEAARHGDGLPDGLAEAVCEAYGRLSRREGVNAVPVAVRSSAVAEDGHEASFAGQQETYLWTVGATDVLARLRDCWASLYTPQAIAYRRRLPADQAAAATRIGVGVQAMVDPVVSGVAFTVSPRTGDRSVVAINASWGLGQAVVSGEVTPDEYWVSKVDMTVTSTRVAGKQYECKPNTSGVKTVPVPAERQHVPCLAPAQVTAVAELAVRIERHYGTPQDIEWALQSPDRLFVLQSRPETHWRTRQAQPVTGYLAQVQAAAAGLKHK